MQETAEQLEEELSALTEEQIKELLEKSVEVDMQDDSEQVSATISAFLENLEREAGAPLSDQDQQASDMDGEEPPPPVPPAAPEIKLYYYDEWDFRAFDYKPRWCTVRERVLEEGTEDFYDKTLHQYAGLVHETQRQFEMLKPENFRKIKKLEDGEDIDLDAAIEFMVQRRSGHGEVPKIYWRRNKIERDVAVAFLLDMSASTDEEIEKHRPRVDGAGNSDPRRYYQSFAQSRPAGVEPPKRIIDLERESLVLLTNALEVIGDRYGIYGFSGYGRENVEYFVIKDLDESFGDEVRRRIDRVTPIRSTRMGPAIRHTTFKLDEIDARAKILFLVSDGRPQDHGYGRDRTEKDYAIHDTHKALVEAKNKGIVPFALTVDKEGHDYLGAMCGDIAYEVLGDIEQMPSRLPTLYRRLTV
jgi:nitric oxide reductase activation protein